MLQIGTKHPGHRRNTPDLAGDPKTGGGESVESFFFFFLALTCCRSSSASVRNTEGRIRVSAVMFPHIHQLIFPFTLTEAWMPPRRDVKPRYRRLTLLCRARCLFNTYCCLFTRVFIIQPFCCNIVFQDSIYFASIKGNSKSCEKSQEKYSWQ